MNPSGQRNSTNKSGPSIARSRLEAFIREQYEQQQQTRNRHSPPTLIEALWHADNSNDDNTQAPINVNAAQVLATSRQQQTMSSDDRNEQSSVSIAQAAEGSQVSTSQLQSILMILAANRQQEQQQRQLERQQQQSQNTAVGLPPRAPAASTPWRIQDSINDSSSRFQHLLELAAQNQQAETNSRSRTAATQSLGMSPPSGGASLGINNLAIPQMHTNEEQLLPPFNSSTLSGISRGLSSGPVLASAMKQRGDLAAAQAQEKLEELLHHQQQHALLGQAPPRFLLLDGLTSSQKIEYLRLLRRQCQQNPGALNAGVPRMPDSGRPSTGMKTASTRFLEQSQERLVTTSHTMPRSGQHFGMHTIPAKLEQVQRPSPHNAQVSRNSYDVSPSALMTVAPSCQLPLGNANRTVFQGHSVQNSAVVDSILQATRQEDMIQSNHLADPNVAKRPNRKRKWDHRENDERQRVMEATKQEVRLPVVGNSFPLPSLLSARNVPPISLPAFQHLWDELQDSEMQEEIFQRRMYNFVKIPSHSRSIIMSARNVPPISLPAFQHLWNELQDSELQEEIFRQRMYTVVKIPRHSRSIQK